MAWPTTMLCAVSLIFAAACGDDSPPPDDGGTDSATDPDTIEAIPLESELSLPGLTAPVEVVQDERGMWHVYGGELTDVLRVEGYLMARDRMGQMDFIRRGANGTLAKLASTIAPQLVQTDADIRFQGHRRNAQRIFETLTPDEVALLEAFSAGINHYIQRLRNEEEFLPRGVDAILTPDLIDDWTPIDTLAIARLQAAQLSFDTDELDLTEAFAAWPVAFPAGDPDPRLAARADAFHDLYPFAPARDVFTRDGFPNVGTDTGTRALRPPPVRVPRGDYEPPPLASLQAARRFLERQRSIFEMFFGEQPRGSNSWVVSGDHTATGQPLLANDPHLGLDSPPLFWYVHLNTKRAGGDVDVMGLALAGTPVVLLGHNDHLAWGLTTHDFDVVDLYEEQISPGAAGEPDTVLFEGAQIPIETITETIELDTGSTMVVQLELVPHHGLIIPETREADRAISLRWTGNIPSNEPAAFFALARAANVDEARDAYENFGVGGQNLVVATDQGDIFWSTQVNLPVRDPRALTYDPATRTGFTPCMVLPGTGEYEWIGMLEDRFLPHDLNPTAGYIATANNDGVGVTADGNPLNDPHYIGCAFADGHRIARIRERLDELVAEGGILYTDLADLQGDAQSPMGRLTTAALIAELDRAEAEMAASGTHPDLTQAVTDLTDAMPRILRMRDRLEGWTSFDTPAGVEGSPTDAEIADSIATTIFNAAFSRLASRLVEDEREALAAGGAPRSRVILRALLDPASMATYDASLDDTVLWDDLRTVGVDETRGEQVLRAFGDALSFLESELGTDETQWRWGRLHTLRLDSIIPSFGEDVLSIPPDGADPAAFPRHGDNFVVDASHYGLYDRTDFSYGSGPVQRLVVDFTTDGPIAYNALPGGQAQDPDSPHHADEMERWRRNASDKLFFAEAVLLMHWERRQRFVP